MRRKEDAKLKAAEQRRERLARELRDNLKKRKSQARERGGAKSAGDEPSGED